LILKDVWKKHWNLMYGSRVIGFLEQFLGVW